MSSEKNKSKTVQTTGHAWDGDIQEFNNPLPTWWLWTFYASVVFTLVYWVLYPSWPVGDSYAKGIATITYTTSDGKTTTTHWNTRALFLKDMQEARAAQEEVIKDINASTFEQIASSEEKSAFAHSMAKVLFADNCAACHQSGGDGVIGFYPNLLDDAWLWGGSFSQIQQSITKGRMGSMPGFKGRLSENQISDVSDYVLSLSGKKVVDVSAVKRGKEVFTNDGGCVACHGADAKGQTFMGSANLTDKIWTIADVAGADTPEAKKAAVMDIVTKGKTRQMPAWKDRLSATEIKMLTFYVKQLSASKQREAR